MRLKWIIIWICCAGVPALRADKAGDSGTNTGADWPMYNRDLAGTRYSPLTQINTANVAKLTQGWAYRLQPRRQDLWAANEAIFQEITPIVVNDVMYMPAGNRVVALDPETGKEIWRYELTSGPRFPARGGVLARRSQQSAAHHLHHRAQDGGAECQDRQDGPRLRKEGEVALEVTYDGAPTIYKNMLLIGTNFYGPGERHIDPALDQAGGQLGDMHEYDVEPARRYGRSTRFLVRASSVTIPG